MTTREAMTIEQAIAEIESRFDSVVKVDAGDAAPAVPAAPLSPEQEKEMQIPFQDAYIEGANEEKAIHAFVDSFPKEGGQKLVWREYPNPLSDEQIAKRDTEAVTHDAKGKQAQPKSHPKDYSVIHARYAVIGPRDEDEGKGRKAKDK